MSTLEIVEPAPSEIIIPKSKTFAKDLAVFQNELEEAVQLEKATVAMISSEVKTINTARNKIIVSHRDKVNVAQKALKYHEAQVHDRMKKLRTSRKSKSPHTLFFMEPDEYFLGTSTGQQCLFFIARKRPDNATYSYTNNWDRAYYWGIKTAEVTRLRSAKDIIHEDITQNIWREIISGQFQGNASPYFFQPTVGTFWFLSKTEIVNLRAFKVEDFKDLDLLTDEEIRKYSDIVMAGNPHYTQSMR